MNVRRGSALAAVCFLSVAGGAIAALPQLNTTPAAQTKPDIVALPADHVAAMPARTSEAVRLLATPRARLLLHPRVPDPSRIVRSSGRMGCSFTLRSIAAGIIEMLFPGTGLVHRGDPLFRLYDPEIIADLTAAERALRSYDVRPLLIAAAPRRRTALPSGPIVDFPTSTVTPQRLPTQRPSESPATARPTPKPQPRAVLKPAPKRPARLKPIPQPPKFDPAPFENAIQEARAALETAKSKLAICVEDHEAKKKLVELGALAQNVLNVSAAKLAAARIGEGDAEARLNIARNRLVEETKRASEAEAAYRAALAEGALDPTDAAPAVEVIRGAEGPAPGATVEVIRGAQVAEAKPQPRAEARKAKPAPSRRAVPARQQPEVAPPARRRGDLQYRDTRALMSARFPAKPKQLDRLSDMRWTEYRAPADGVVVERSVSNGSSIEAGQELLKLINTQWAQTYVRVAREDVERFLPGTVVSVTFDDYPDVVFEGWIDSLQPERGGEAARAEIIVFCRNGYYGTDAFATLQWLALATPLNENGDTVEPVEPVVTDTRAARYHRSPQAYFSLVPEDVWELSMDEAERERSDKVYEGQLQLVEYSGAQQAHEAGSAERQRLAQLIRWREEFVDGMTRTLFDRSVVLTYPRSGEVREAIERMATRRVTHVPNRCARTMREALGWGLGDAHVWARQLPRRGYVARRDGLARPGDILVWPFTFPPRGSQHIGIAVQQNGKLMLLSNLEGRLGTSEIEPGYVAFQKPSKNAS